MQQSNQASKEELEMALNKAKEIVSSFPVVIFGKTYCGYCRKAKELLTQLGASFKVIELDEEKDGDEIQSALTQWTGQRTVPNVFIGGKHIGGCDALLETHQEGKLVPLLTDAGAIANTYAQM
ncbi:hypothetical protein Dsin_011660 [Dipteronia sinensis]|uniref:Glutaredoxin domain-containing protein n=1 Tax=Dipteronia sinensis TaxID=43782 RepID=A0AAE0E8P2_9ROSI|nr:hypothetical protein Dsin_011660 [Dipteronia sinensis]